MFAYILKVTVCLVAFYGLYMAAFRQETFFHINRWYLVTTLLISMLLPLLVIMPVFSFQGSEAGIASYTLEPIAIGIQDISTTLDPDVSGPGWVTLLPGIYWIVVSLLAIRFVRGLWSLYTLYRNGERLDSERSYQIIRTDAIVVPFSFFHWIFLPKDHSLSDKELDEIVIHEAAHATSLHSIDVILMELAAILLWPSPVIYFYRKSLRRVHEYHADSAVLRNTPLKQYGEFLLSQVTSGMQLALANHFFQNQIKDRIHMMTKNKSRRSALLKYTASIPVILVVFSLFAFRQNNASPDMTLMTGVSSDTVYQVVEVMPRFPGCEESGLTGDDLYQCSLQKMLEHVYVNITYPAEARKQNISGRVVVKFIIRQDGTATDAEIIRSIGGGTDQAVLDVIHAMPRWRPGYQHGEAVDVQFILPVAFQLDDTPKQAETEDRAKVTSRSAEAPVYKVVEEMPRFPGCEEKGLDRDNLRACSKEELLSFVTEHLVYPEEAQKNKIEGRAVVQFTINSHGEIEDPKIVRSIGYGTDAAVLDVINAMPVWRPGYQKGEPVDVIFTLPVLFRLSDSDEKK